MAENDLILAPETVTKGTAETNFIRSQARLDEINGIASGADTKADNALALFEDSGYPNIKPSLLLNFAATKSLDPRITFTRASEATYLNDKGLLSYAAVDEPVFDHDPVTGECKGLGIWEARTNLLKYSEDFSNAVWQKTATGLASLPQVSLNYGTAPDGTLTATRVDLSINGGTTTTDNCYIMYTADLSVVGQPTLCSVFLKTVDGSTKTLRFDFNGSTADIAPFNVPLLTVTGKWQRFTIGLSSAIDTQRRFALRLRGSLGTSDSASVLVWGATQENNVTFPTPYIPSTETFTSRASTATYIGSDGLIKIAASNAPRMQYTPDNLGLRPKLLLEGASTNLLTYSEQFDNAGWTKARASITPNVILAPDGTLTADKLVEDTSASTSHYIRHSPTLSGTTTHTFTIFAKSAGRHINITTFGSNGWIVSKTVIVNLIDGSYTGEGVVEHLPGGWFKISLTNTTGAETKAYAIDVLLSSVGDEFFTGDGTSGIYLWGAQLEQSPYPTSYIPTTSVAVTRAADVSSSAATTRAADIAQMTGSNFSDWYRQDEGSFVCKYQLDYKLGASRVLSVGTADAYMELISATGATADVGNGGYLYGKSDGVVGSIATSGILNVALAIRHVAFGYKKDDFASSVNGITAKVDTTGSVPPVDRLRFTNNVGEALLCGHIAYLAYYPKRISNTELQVITQ